MADDELKGFAKSMLSLANEISEGNEVRRFIGASGTKLKRRVLSKAKRKVNVHSGTYIKSIKRGRVWQKNGSISVNIYSDDNKAHLIEKGHRIVARNGREVGFRKGEYVFSEASDDHFKEFENEVDKFMDKVLEGL